MYSILPIPTERKILTSEDDDCVEEEIILQAYGLPKDIHFIILLCGVLHLMRLCLEFRTLLIMYVFCLSGYSDPNSEHRDQAGGW